MTQSPASKDMSKEAEVSTLLGAKTRQTVIFACSYKSSINPVPNSNPISSHQTCVNVLINPFLNENTHKYSECTQRLQN
jgi:hypothetical protein